jgi:hypothetical protein
MECSFDERREYSARAVIHGTYRYGDEKCYCCTVMKIPRGLDAALRKSKIGPKEGIPDRRGGR